MGGYGQGYGRLYSRKKTIPLHWFVYLTLFYTQYSSVPISTGLALSKIQAAVLLLKSKKRGEPNQICKRETFVFPQQPTFPGETTDWNKCSSGRFTGNKARWQTPPLPPGTQANAGIAPSRHGEGLAQKPPERGSGRRCWFWCAQRQRSPTVAAFYVITSDDFRMMAFNILCLYTLLWRRTADGFRQRAICFSTGETTA